jgi:hypothetical protein
MPILAGDIVLDVALALVENPPYITFPSGLFTQQEILTYIDEVQLDFLTKIRPVYKRAGVVWTPNVQIYTQPDDCLWLERIENGGVSLRNTSQANLDLYSSGWAYEDPTPNPLSWYQDQTAVNQYGVRPAPLPFSTVIVSANNASPILMQTQDPHGLTTGMEVSNTGCLGNTGANGVYVVQVLSLDQALLLGSVGNGVYVANSGVMSLSTQLWYSQKIAVPSTMSTPLLVPFVFSQYVKWGVLSRAWAKDSEQRNPQNAKFCELRYNFGILLASRFLAWSKMESGLQSEATALRNFPIPAIVEKAT